MNIQHYDADTHEPVERAYLSRLDKAHADLLRERDEARAHAALEAESANKAWDAVNAARAEVERLNALIHETAAAWIGAELGIPFEGAIDGAMRAAVAEVERLRGELDYRNEAPDAAVLRAEGTTLAKMTRDAVGDEPDAHALAVYGYVSKVDQFLTRLRAAPPVNLTDIEGLANELALTGEHRKHIVNTAARFTRPIDREGLLNAMALWLLNSSRIQGVPSGEMLEECADAVLAYLGAQAAQPVDYNALAQAIDEGLVKSANDERPDCDRAADAALAFLGLKSAGRPQTEEEVEALEPAQPVEPKARDKSADDCKGDLDGYHAAAPYPPRPKPPEPAWTEEQCTAVLKAGFLALRPHTPGWTDACCAAIAKVAPLFAAKVRVKLPTESIFHASDGEALLRRSVVVVLLREQGVEVDE